MMSQPESKLEQIFSELMVGETVPVCERTKVTCLTWDSLMQLNLISAIEQEFQITITDEEAIDLNSFSVALHLVREKLTSKPSGDGQHVPV